LGKGFFMESPLEGDLFLVGTCFLLLEVLVSLSFPLLSSIDSNLCVLCFLIPITMLDADNAAKELV